MSIFSASGSVFACFLVAALTPLLTATLYGGSNTELLSLSGGGGTGGLTPAFDPAVTVYSGGTEAGHLFPRPLAKDAEAVIEARINGGAYQRLAPGNTLSVGGGFFLALKPDGTVTQWGLNFYGGHVVPPANLNNVASVAAGGGYCLALLKDGTVRGWGPRDTGPALTGPVSMTGVSAIHIASGYASYVFKNDGTLRSWGGIPTPAGVTGVVSVTQGMNFAVAAKSDGTLLAWDRAGFKPSFIPPGLGGVVKVEAAGANYVALKADGTLTGWMENVSNSPFPVDEYPVPSGLKDVTDVCAGYGHFLALTKDGSVIAWGKNSAAKVPHDLGPAAVIAAGGGMGMTIGKDGRLTMWGNTPTDDSPFPSGAEFSTPPRAAALPLRPGSNTAEVRVTPPAGGPAKTYTLNLNRALNSKLRALEPDRGLLSPAFSPDVTSYSLSVPFANEAMRFRAVTAVTGLPVTWNGAAVPADVFTEPLPLAPGANAFVFTVTAEDGVTKKGYTVNITREAPDTEVGLRFLADGAGALTPAFSPERLTYTHAQPVNKPRLVFWPKPASVSSKVEIRANDGPWTQTASANQAAYAAVLDPEGFPVVWNPEDLYQRLPMPESRVPCAGLSPQEGGTYFIRTDGKVIARDPARPVPAELGKVVEIVELNGSEYVILALHGNGTVSAWNRQTGERVTAFSGENTLVSLFGGWRALGLRRDGTVAAWTPGNQGGEVNLPPGLDRGVALASGASSFLGLLRSDGSLSAHAFNPPVQEPAPHLRALAIDPFYHGQLLFIAEDGSLGATSIDQHHAPVPEGLRDVRLVRSSIFSHMAVEGNGGITLWDSHRRQASPPGLKARALPEAAVLPLNLGENRVEVRVTAENGAQRVYTIAVTRAPNLELASVTLGAGEFPVNLSDETLTYALTVPGTRESLSVAPLAADSTATVKVNGVAVERGQARTVALNPGENSVLVELTSQDGVTKRVYTLTITRALPDTGLRALATSAGPLTPEFTPGTRDYTLRHRLPHVTVWACPSSAGAVLEARAGGNGDWTRLSAGTLLAPPAHSGQTRFDPPVLLAIRPDGTVRVRRSPNTTVPPLPGQPENLSGAVSVAAGPRHCVVLKADGTVTAWGEDAWALPPPGLVNVSAIAAAGYCTLAVHKDGAVTGWGVNTDGQLDIPAGLNDVVTVVPVGNRVAALRRNGQVAVWGGSPPVTVPDTLQGVVGITAFETRLVALLDNGRVAQWESSSGNLLPEVDQFHDIVAVSGQLVLRRDGALLVYRFGGALQIETGGPVAALESGLAVRADGSTLYLDWLGMTQETDVTLPARPSWFSAPLTQGENTVELRVTEGSARATHRLSIPRRAHTDLRFLAADGVDLTPVFDRTIENYALGSRRGPLVRVRPVPVNPAAVVETRANGGEWVRTASADAFSSDRREAWPGGPVSSVPLALLRDGTVYGWNLTEDFGQTGEQWFGRRAVSVSRSGTLELALLDDGTPAGHLFPPETVPELGTPPFLKNLSAVSAGETHALALGQDGRVFAWGRDEHGDGRATVPAGLTDAVQIRAGAGHSLALRANGTVIAWGLNDKGQTAVPAGLSGVVAIAAGHTQSMALKSNGTVAVWGVLADGSTGAPEGLKNVTMIAAEGGVCVALREDGTALRWGDASPAAGPGASPAAWRNAADLAPGYGHALAALPDGTLAPWLNASGSLWLTKPAAVFPRFASLPLRYGSNLLEVRVTEPDGSASAITALTVTRLPSADLTSLSLTGAALSPAFSTETVNYTAEVPHAMEFLTLQLSTVEPGAAVTVNDSPVSSGSATVGLTPGANLITITVKAQDGVTVRSWRISVTRAAASDNTFLNLLTTAAGPLTPAFTPAVREYTQDFRFAKAALRASPAAAGARMDVSFNGGPFQQLATGNRIALSYFHALTVRGDGMVAMWPIAGHAAPVEPPAGLSGVVSVAAGAGHFVALKSDGTVTVWGDNNYGQMAVPAGLNRVIAISAAGNRTLALKEDGAVTAWGEPVDARYPVPELRDAVAIAADFAALRRDGSAVIWGYDPATGPSVPEIPGPATAVSATGVVLPDGRPVWWSGTGQVPAWSPALNRVAWLDSSGTAAILPDGTANAARFTGTQDNLPEDLGGILAITGYRGLGYAVLEDGTVRGWGSSRETPSGPVADTRPLFIPLSLRPGLNTAKVRVTAEDGVTAENYQIQINRLPNTELTSLRVPEAVLAPVFNPDVLEYSAAVPQFRSSVRLIAEVEDPTSAIAVNGAPAVSGRPLTLALNPGENRFTLTVTAEDGATVSSRVITITRAASTATRNLRALGTGAGEIMSVFQPEIYSYEASAAPETTFWPRVNGAGVLLSWRLDDGLWEPLNPSDLPPVTGSSNFALALRPDKSVIAWGLRTGAGGDYAVPEELGGVTAISGGDRHMMALEESGQVRVWGYNTNGVLNIPPGLPEAVAIAAGKNHCLALSADGKVTAWGRNAERQCVVPEDLPPLVAVAGGSVHSTGISLDGRVFSWGGVAQNRVPAALPPVVAISAGDDFSVALKNDGTVAAWGGADTGRISVPAGLGDVVQISCGSRHTLALKRDGTVAAWGDNNHGQRAVPADLNNVAAVSASGSLSMAVKKDGSVVVWGISSAGQRNIPAGLIVSASPSAVTVPTSVGQTRVGFLVSSPDGADSHTYTVIARGADGSPYNLWAAGVFPAGTAAERSGPQGDFDGDGILNAVEYLTGSDPLGADGAAPLSAREENGELVISFRRRAGVPAGVETVESASSLEGGWTPVPAAAITITAGATPGESSTVTARLPLEEGERRFFRLKITFQPDQPKLIRRGKP